MIIVITGQTCTSKSKIAIQVAKAFNAEIVNADAFQIYKELDIGTAKPEKDDLLKVKHHLYNFLEPTDRYSIYEYQSDCRRVISEITAKHKNVVLVGGSGLYIRSALYDYDFKTPEREVDLSDYYTLTNEELHARLAKIDPKEASKVHPNNRKRVLRAIFIYLAYNKTKTELESMQEHKIIYKDVHIYAIDMDKKDLYERIDKRVELMIRKGLIKEAHTLANKYGKDLQAFNAIGYREIIQNPDMGTEDVAALISKDTRKYAKRQMTFIKYQYGDNVKWVKSAEDIIKDLNNNDISARTRILLGDKNLEKIKKLKVAIFGLGGVGGTAAEALARTGVKKLYLFDSDTVMASNLNRQILYTSNDIGLNKAKIAKQHFETVNPDLKVKATNLFIAEENLNEVKFEKFDYVIDAIDSTKSKIALIKYCLKNNIPFISSLGMGNRVDLTKLEITTLDKTHDDPLAKKLREELKKDKVDLRKIKVVASTETPKKTGNLITSMIFVPSTAGLLLASHVVNQSLKEKE